MLKYTETMNNNLRVEKNRADCSDGALLGQLERALRGDRFSECSGHVCTNDDDDDDDGDDLQTRKATMRMWQK